MVSVRAASSLTPSVRVVSVTVRLMPVVRAVRLSCQASVALVTLMVMLVSVVLRVSASLVTLLVVFLAVGAGGGAPMVRVPGALGAAPRCRVISSPLLAEDVAGVAAGEVGGCIGVVAGVGAAWGGRW